jgi:LysR family glycine cleavage system transcriptional activator
MFETVARLGSTVAAARELGLTHGAVSRRVRALEDNLGSALLTRGRGGRLVPTETGARFAEAAGHAFALIAEAAQSAGRGTARRKVVRINATASFASLWLIPRLNRFRARHPAFEAWVSESQSLIEPGAHSGIDITIRSGNGRWPGVKAEKLMDDVLITVAAPSIKQRLRKPTDLARLPLLHDEDPAISWSEFADRLGLGNPDWATTGPRLASSLLLIQAAIAGDGVALVPARLAEAHLAKGDLITPLAVKLAHPLTYWLVRPQRALSSPAIRAVTAWLRAEARNKT